MRILISAPYFLPVVEDYRARLEAEGMELVVADVRERLSEQELLPLVPATAKTRVHESTIHNLLNGLKQAH